MDTLQECVLVLYTRAEFLYTNMIQPLYKWGGGGREEDKNRLKY